MRLSVGLALACLVAAAPSARADIVDDVRNLREQSVLLTGTEAKKLLTEQWAKFDSRTLERREQALHEIRGLGKQLATDQIAGRSRECSSQIFLEAKWRALYTADFESIDRRIQDLEFSLSNDNQAYAAQQSSDDGSWGICFEPMFAKLEATMFGLQLMYRDNVAPKYAIGLLPEIQSADDAVARLAGLLVSDIANQGIDHRSEMAALTTISAQFQFKAYWQAYLEDTVEGLIRDREPGGIAKIRTEVRRLLDAWQDPITGYWGMFYRIGTQTYRTTDLSITFHLVSYLRGDVQYWPQIIETTFRIEDEPYPYGWRYGASSNNHNNYDVVKIFRYGWPHMTGEQRVHARASMRHMLDWALQKSLQPDGSFASDESFFSSVASDFYFGVSFLSEIGYWQADKRFWTNESFPGGEAKCVLIRGRLAELRLTSPFAVGAEEKLAAACG
jgi:hypothetical protein